MNKVRVCYDRTGNTLAVWFDNPRQESVCEEIGDDVVVIKDDQGRVIGFDRMNDTSPTQQDRGINVPVEIQVIGA